ncbi:hypothetical protein IGI37_000960 [Enterococcus sp. AZ194]
MISTSFIINLSNNINSWLAENGDKFIDILTAVFVFISVLLISGIFLILYRMGDDERTDSLIFKIGTFSLLIYVFLNSIVVNLNLTHWKLFLTVNLSLTALTGFIYTVVKYYKFLK